MRSGENKAGIVLENLYLSALWAIVFGTVPALAAPTNVLSGGDFEPFSIGIVSPKIDDVALLDSYSFDTIYSFRPEYAPLSGHFTPLFSGTYLLSVEILRNYQVSSVSPKVYLDNVTLSFETVPVVPAPALLHSAEWAS
jgi:hypothetical protein